MNKKIIITVLVVLILGIRYMTKDESTPFNRSEWLASKHCKPIKEASKRFSMLEDLTSNYLKGKSGDEIKELLGEPEGSDTLSSKRGTYFIALENLLGYLFDG